VIVARWRELQARHPGIRWLARWGLSLASLASGIITLSLFRRGLEYFPWVVGYLLLLWLAGVVFAEARETLEARGRRLMRVAYDYTLQSLYWHLLLFLLPIYYASTTLDSRNVLFLGTLGAATLVTAVDPLYRATVLRSRWGYSLVFGYALFVTLLVALPLIGVRSGGALILAAAASMVALVPTARRSFRLSWQAASLAGILAAVCAALLVWLARAAIPPVPLHLLRGTFAQEVQALAPVLPISRLTAREARAWDSLACFTALAAPAGLQEPVLHVWRKDGASLARVPLTPVLGGRPGGFRTYSRLTSLGADPAGSWRVDVLTAHGQLIGRVRLTINR
jgi:hypothetical protein